MPKWPSSSTHLLLITFAVAVAVAVVIAVHLRLFLLSDASSKIGWKVAELTLTSTAVARFSAGVHWMGKKQSGKEITRPMVSL